MNPSRPEVLQHVDSVWGFGRRGCPGKAFAEANLWLAIANIIAVMDIRKVLGEDGNPITPAGEFEPGAIRWVKEQYNEDATSFDLFSSDIRSRSSVQLPTALGEHDDSSQTQ